MCTCVTPTRQIFMLRLLNVTSLQQSNNTKTEWYWILKIFRLIESCYEIGTPFRVNKSLFTFCHKYESRNKLVRRIDYLSPFTCLKHLFDVNSKFPN